jgi:hypothetical protein
MEPIIPSFEIPNKRNLTAREMFRLWNWKRSDEIGVCEFAEAYAAHKDEESARLIEEDGDLLRQAAELLLREPNVQNEMEYEQWDAAWVKDREDWLRHAGMEKK